MRQIFIAVILTWSSSCFSAEIDIDFWLERWRNESAWVKDLPREEQSVVVHLLLKRLTARIGDDLMPRAKSAREKRTAVKVFFDGVSLLPDLAKNSPELKKSLEFYEETSLRFANNQIKPSQLSEEMKRNDQTVDRALSTVPSRYFNTVPIQYKTLLARTSAAVVVTALKLNGWQYGDE